MEIVAIIVAVVLGFLAIRFVAGVVKYGILALLVLAGLYFAGVFN
jgi:hypothetical protein